MEKPSVLLLECSKNLREILKDILELHGMFVTTAESCSEALIVLEEFRPDLIISATKLLDGDSYSLLKQWREHESINGWEPIPAIAICGKERWIHEPLARAAGFDVYLSKPFELEEFLVALRSILSVQK